ncbi:MAG: aldolase [Acidimicrobiia bacterium]|nr:aldolase [Acidimicrobiia bacterium]
MARFTKERTELAATLRWAARLGLNEGICNHFSVAVTAEGNQFLVNPLGYHWSEITASDLVLADKDRNVLEGGKQVENTAFFIHSRLHLASPKARCILHTHMPFATALCLLENGRLEMASQNAIRFYERISYVNEYRGFALDNTEGDRLAAGMGHHDVAFLGAHGVIVTGSTLAEAFDDLYYLERACQVQVIALSTRGKLRRLPPEIVRNAARGMQEDKREGARLHLEAIQRILNREEPEYAN